MEDKQDITSPEQAQAAQEEKKDGDQGVEKLEKKDEKEDEFDYISLVQLVKEKSKEEQIIRQLSKNSKSPSFKCLTQIFSRVCVEKVPIFRGLRLLANLLLPDLLWGAS